MCKGKHIFHTHTLSHRTKMSIFARESATATNFTRFHQKSSCKYSNRYRKSYIVHQVPPYFYHFFLLQRQNTKVAEFRRLPKILFFCIFLWFCQALFILLLLFLVAVWHVMSGCAIKFIYTNTSSPCIVWIVWFQFIFRTLLPLLLSLHFAFFLCIFIVIFVSRIFSRISWCLCALCMYSFYSCLPLLPLVFIVQKRVAPFLMKWNPWQSKTFFSRCWFTELPLIIALHVAHICIFAVFKIGWERNKFTFSCFVCL